MLKRIAVLASAAAIATIVISASGNEKSGNSLTQPVTPPSSTPGADTTRIGRDPEPESSFAISCATYTSTQWGHSCSTFFPKDKAKEKAIEAAKADIIDQWNGAHSFAGNPCGAGNYVMGVGNWGAYTVTVLNEVKDRTGGCGWDVQVRVTGDACLTCGSN